MPAAWLIVGLLLYALWVAVATWIRRAMDDDQDAEGGFIIRVFHVYAAIVHRLEVVGRGHIPRGRPPGPLIIVANHTAGVDPVLIQSACPFRIRWLMAEDMRTSVLDPFWELGQVIMVDRRRGESLGVREALRHLRAGGVIGVFPEGHLERPPREVLPFLPGVGVLVARSGARVQMVTIEGTPQVDPAWSSLWRTSRSRVRFYEPIDYRGKSAREIPSDLRARFINALGWPPNEVVPRLVDGRWMQLDVEGRWPAPGAEARGVY
ncbi:MAG: 1-acyl-sn-glycerol-3-phosphate acyltransferase [Phycisphaerales bacterium]|nr:1-acyl-sn-glycerol-3-phosphate acyltransferase [Phycisphaerales bacterium]